MKITMSEAKALLATREGKVKRVYRASGNVFNPPPGVSARTLWTLLDKRLVADGPSASGIEMRCTVRLTEAGNAALLRHPLGRITEL